MAKPKKQGDVRQRLVNDAAKALLANIRFMSIDRPIKTIGITSTIPNEGKTFVSVNLAQAVASSSSTCLLVEGDLRKRSLAASMNIHPKHGLYSVLSGKIPFNQVAVATPQRNLFFLDAEPQIPNPPDILGSQRFLDFLEKISGRFDYIIFDLPPVGVFIDAAVVASHVDATFLVVRENFTKKAAIVASCEQLEQAGACLSGVVMNDCSDSSDGYGNYYGYYNSYGSESTSGKTAVKRVEGALKNNVVREQAGSGSHSRA